MNNDAETKTDIKFKNSCKAVYLMDQRNVLCFYECGSEISFPSATGIMREMKILYRFAANANQATVSTQNNCFINPNGQLPEFSYF